MKGRINMKHKNYNNRQINVTAILSSNSNMQTTGETPSIKTYSALTDERAANTTHAQRDCTHTMFGKECGKLVLDIRVLHREVVALCVRGCEAMSGAVGVSLPCVRTKIHSFK
jgi:hypothetical protein